ncbi:uncharacterized protein LOC112194687 [Rosa chinensis]|uniref:uncharacterized protein LOC112194687 n=1 Tax=Rosa chinensis TaxID=74649 RepID=UPI000D0886D0|nr:uncharacterized protein LOC112194687 [Rosa chinensis]
MVWSPASNATLTLNVDGAFLSQLTKGGLGGALRDSRGIVHAAYQIAAPFVSSALHAELLAIKVGLQLLSLHNFQSVCIQSDCLLVVQDINGNSTNHTEYGTLIEDIQFMLQQLQQIHVSYTPRTCNKIAHRLANLAFESEQTMYWIQETPDCIRDIVLKELPPLT